MSVARNRIVAAAQRVAASCLKLTESERMVMIFDDSGIEIAHAFSEALVEASHRVCSRYVPAKEQEYRSASGVQPEKYLGCCDSGVLLTILAKLDSCNAFRAEVLDYATGKGMRIVHLPGVNSAMFVADTEGVDFEAVYATAVRLIALLSKAKEIVIVTAKKNGQLVELAVPVGLHPVRCCGGVARPGEIMNIPTGEVYLAPCEHLAHGDIVLNGAARRSVFWRKSGEVVLHFESGKLDMTKSEFPSGDSGGAEARGFQEYLQSLAENPHNFVLGELGIGINPTIRELRGSTVRDEKTLGTAHIALGANRALGGDLKEGVHNDLIVVPRKLLVDGSVLEWQWWQT